MSKDTKVEPVYVIEAIPTGGENAVSSDDITRDAIPTPAHLRIYPELGRGAMGRIHPATDRNLLRHVALKRLDRQLARQPFYRDGFVAEAQITGQLEHPNIVPVHELGVSEEGVPYFTMKLVQGVSFAHWMARPAHALGTTERIEEGLAIFVKVCDAVAYAHHRGVVHRDLKPENIMVGDFGEVYLMDWGLARLTKSRPASGAQAQMETEGPVGTPGFMAPEQARGVPAEMNEACDIFGLGAVLYELVSGETPFGDASADELLERTRKGDVVPIDRALNGLGVSKRLRNIIERAVQPRPEDRFASVKELQAAVRAFLRGGLHLPRKVFREGELILREGDMGDTAFMIVNGRCRAFCTVDGQEQDLGIMEAGDVFGEMALVLSRPRAASVVAIDGPVAVLVLDKHTMSEGLGIDGWVGALVRALAQRFRTLEDQVRHSGMRRGQHD